MSGHDPGMHSMRVLREREVVERCGISRSTMRRLLGRGMFPPGRRLGPNSIGWLAAEVDAWLSSRPVAHGRR
jgi:prophage regulatory protein